MNFYCILLGKSTCLNKKLICGVDILPKCDKYNNLINTSTAPEFIQSVFRLFHENIREDFELFDKNNKVTQRFQFYELTNKTRLLETRFMEVLRGMLKLKMRSKIKGYVDQVRLL